MKHLIWLAETGVGSEKCRSLLDHFETGEAVWRADIREMTPVCPLTDREQKRLSDKSLRRADEILGACSQLQVSLLSIYDRGYSDHLRNIHDAPILLYVSGKLPDFEALPTITIVGQRKATPAGLLIAEKLAYELSYYGLSVISGMAEGIDSAAHKGALKGGTPTVAVLGTAIDNPYPKSSIPLYRSILRDGAVISEYPPGSPTSKISFPRRNRIMSGLSMGTLVVEAAKESGSLITAHLAADQGRQVYAIPGAVDAHTSDGTNDLIKDGAKLITGAYDIISDYAPMYGIDLTVPPPVHQPPKSIRAAFEKPPAPPTDDPVLNAISGSVHVDEIAAASGLGQPEVLARLTMLEVEGRVRQLPNQYFERIN